MPAVNLAPYDAQMAELERRQRIAQALAAAGAEQQDVPAYKGISAMPSRAGMLANVLKSYAGARQERNIGRDRTILGKQDTAAGQEFAQQMLRGMNPQQPPQAAPAPAAPPQAAPTATPQDASGLPWGAVAQGEAPTGWFDGQQAAPAAGAYNPASGAGLTGVATNPASLAAAMGGAPAAPPQAPQAPPAAPQTAKTPGGNSPPPTYSPEQLQATIAAGLASPYPSVRAQAQAMMPMVNQHLQRSQQLADRDEGRAYAQGQTDKQRGVADKLGQNLLDLIPQGVPGAIRLAVQAQVRVGDLDGAAKTLGDAISGPGGKMHVVFDGQTANWVVAQENSDGSLSNINHYDAFSQGDASQPLSPEQAARLPSGTEFTGLDGVKRVKH